jgi:lipoprotein NlpI
MVLTLPRQWSALTLAVLALAAMAVPARAQSWRDLKCTGNPDLPWAEQVAGCTQAIGSGRFSGTGLAELLNNRGNAYMGTGDLGHALADFDRAISLAPDSAEPYNGRGIAYAAKNDFDHALADLTQAIRLAPSYALAFNNRGLLLRPPSEFRSRHRRL